MPSFISNYSSLSKSKKANAFYKTPVWLTTLFWVAQFISVAEANENSSGSLCRTSDANFTNASNRITLYGFDGGCSDRKFSEFAEAPIFTANDSCRMSFPLASVIVIGVMAALYLASYMQRPSHVIPRDRDNDNPPENASSSCLSS